MSIIEIGKRYTYRGPMANSPSDRCQCSVVVCGRVLNDNGWPVGYAIRPVFDSDRPAVPQKAVCHQLSRV